ncbi:hypothetical protein BZL29_4543 [Mycobacterium kansasii]|uniref:Uncharacterized protein n=1 Tax=Mycobacterium kansasii TaxID=1768 RepID=A0A1V3X6U5_MYCKA|nr:hypothetical protein BZL29_4543 [Mycobacterium kansasii]
MMHRHVVHCAEESIHYAAFCTCSFRWRGSWSQFDPLRATDRDALTLVTSAPPAMIVDGSRLTCSTARGC